MIGDFYEGRIAPVLGHCVVLAVRLTPAPLRDPVLVSVLGIASRPRSHERPQRRPAISVIAP